MTINTPTTMTDAEWTAYQNAFAAYGGTVVDVRDGDAVVVRFSDQQKMLELIGAIKSARPDIFFNTKLDDDGAHVATISSSRIRRSA